MNTTTTIDINAVPDFYKAYVAYVKDQDVIEALKESGEAAYKILKDIPEENGEHRYAPGKWSIKELLCHLMDAERIFAYRALRFARNDKTPLSGFDENEYATEANASSRTVSQLAEEMKNLRLTSIDLFKSLTSEMLERTGMSSNKVMTTLSWGYIIAGHERHHLKIIQERYLD